MKKDLRNVKQMTLRPLLIIIVLGIISTSLVTFGFIDLQAHVQLIITSSEDDSSKGNNFELGDTNYRGNGVVCPNAPHANGQGNHD